MSNIKELIFAEIKRLIRDPNLCSTTERRIGGHTALLKLLAFLDTLPDESEQPTRGYDEAYLNEKIAKASKSWEGVDVDKFMDEIRGREPVTDCHDLEEAAMNYIAPIENEDGLKVINFSGRDIKDAFIAGAEWGADHLRDTTKKVSEDLKEAAENSWVDYEYREDPRGLYSSCYIDGFKAGAEWKEKQMMKEHPPILDKYYKLPQKR